MIFGILIIIIVTLTFIVRLYNRADIPDVPIREDVCTVLILILGYLLGALLIYDYFTAPQEAEQIAHNIFDW